MCVLKSNQLEVKPLFYTCEWDQAKNGLQYIMNLGTWKYAVNDGKM